MSEFRHEYKYVCSKQHIEYVKNNISPLMDMDPNADAGGYEVRSLYLDDYHNSFWNENLAGTDPREKIRIRIYNGDTSIIRLEIKQKRREKTKKLSCVISEEVCRAIIEGRKFDIKAVDSDVFRKFYVQYETRLLKPAVIVEYDRIPYVYRDGNVRVTFDMNMRSSNEFNCFLDKSILSRPIMPINKHLIEVKFDEYLPDPIYQGIETESLKRSTFSKYFLCRKYNQGGIIL